MTPPYRFEPLSEKHDRASFHCGVPELDGYFQHRIGQDAKRKVAAPFVMLDADDEVIGYYTLSACSIHLNDLPVEIVRKLPRYPQLPATLLGRLAVSARHRGRKLGRFLLVDALYRSWKATAQVASVCVVVDAIDEAARDFYLHHEFQPLGDFPSKLFLPMATIAKAFPAQLTTRQP